MGLGGVVSAVAGSSLGSIAGGMGLGLFDSAVGYHNDKRLMERQHGFTKEMAQNQYQWSVTDMKKAGLNPMLAATGGLKPGTAPIGGVPGGNRPNSAGAIKELALLDAQEDKLRAEAYNIRKTAELTGNKVGITESAEEIAQEVVKVINIVKETGNMPSQIINNVRSAQDGHDKAKEIRKSPGIKLTPDTRKKSEKLKQKHNKQKKKEFTKNVKGKFSVYDPTTWW